MPVIAKNSLSVILSHYDNSSCQFTLKTVVSVLTLFVSDGSSHYEIKDV